MKSKDYRLEEISVADIDFGDRVRDPLKDPALMAYVKGELIPSIEKSGLITPICVLDKNSFSGLLVGEPQFKLLAGGCRFRSFEVLGRMKIPAMIFERELTELEIAIIEESENLKRRDFSPAEKAASYAKVHRLLQAEHGAATPGRYAGSESGWGLKETAEFLGKSTGQVSEMLKLNEMFEKKPETKQLFTTTTEASAFLRKAQRGAETFVKARAVEQERANTPEQILKRKLQSCYILGDFFQEAKKIQNGLFDLIEVDPPYSIDLQELRKNGKNSTIGYNEIDTEQYPLFLELLIKESWRLLKADGWLLLWFGPDPWQQVILDQLKSTGFQVRNLPAIWNKGSFSEEKRITGGGMQSLSPAYFLSRSYESFFYARKGNVRLAKPGRPDCFEFPNIPAQQRTHPTQRPAGLMKAVLETFAEPGANILVPFAGSGVTLIEAFKLGMKPVGFDLGQNYKDGFTVEVENMEIKL